MKRLRRIEIGHPSLTNTGPETSTPSAFRLIAQDCEAILGGDTIDSAKLSYRTLKGFRPGRNDVSQSLSNIIVHIVFSTKHRKRFMCAPVLRDELWKMLGGTSKSLDCPPLIVGGAEDHVHLLARQSRKIAVADWVKELKRTTSMWIKKRDQNVAAFQWQAGYGAFSVSQSNSAQVIEYIRNQEEHHRRIDFQTEFRKLLERHGIEFDERYVWD